MPSAAVVIIGYLLGSIPFGYLIVRATQDADIRETGSGGTGATNVSRRAGKAAGVFTLLLDVLKGAAAVIVALWVFGLPFSGWTTDSGFYWWVVAAGIAAIVGHMFPLWLGFRGGKGVATGVGVFVVLTPWLIAISALLFLIVVSRTRYVSLGSMVAVCVLPILLLIQDTIGLSRGPFIPLLTATLTGALLIVFAHRENIKRLLAGTEAKFK